MPGLTWNGLSRAVVSRDCQSALDDIPLHLERRARSSASPPDYSEMQLAPLAKVIEADIIPRLMLAHGTEYGVLPPVQDRQNGLSPEDVAVLTRIVLEQDASQAAQFVGSVRTRGVTHEAIYLKLLAPVARHLGELWEADMCDFVEVTVALGRLHQVLRRVSPLFRDREDEMSDLCIRDRRILLATIAGEQHFFGLSIVEEFFRSAGWDVCGGMNTTNQSLSSLVRADWFDVVGFSVGAQVRLDDLTTCICSVRAASLNQEIAVLVGGPLFVGHPELVSIVGADATSDDAQQAVAEAELLVASRR